MPYPLHFRPISYQPSPQLPPEQSQPSSHPPQPSPSKRAIFRRNSSIYTNRKPSSNSLTSIFRRKSSSAYTVLSNPFRRKSSVRTITELQERLDERYEWDDNRISYFSDSERGSVEGERDGKRDSGAVLRGKSERRKLVRRTVPEPVAMGGRRLSAMGGERSRDVVSDLIAEITKRLSGGEGRGRGSRGVSEENLMLKQGIAAKDRRRRLKKGMKRWSEEAEEGEGGRRQEEEQYPEWI